MGAPGIRFSQSPSGTAPAAMQQAIQGELVCEHAGILDFTQGYGLDSFSSLQHQG